MNTLLTTQNAWVANPATSRSAPAPKRKPDAAWLFIAASAAVHLGGLTVMGSLPRPAHAATEAVQFEVMLEADAPEPVVPPVEEAAPLPRGRLDAEESIRTARLAPQAPAVAQPAASPQTAASQQTAAPPAAAPEVLTARSANPYASTSFKSTAGTAKTRTTRRVTSAPSPTTTAAGFGVENGSDEASPEKAAELKTWYNRVRAVLAARARSSYPRRAQTLRQEGMAKVSVTVSASGSVVSASLQSSSGHSLLDQAAVSGVKNAGQLPAPPSGVGTQTLYVPVRFQL